MPWAIHCNNIARPFCLPPRVIVLYTEIPQYILRNKLHELVERNRMVGITQPRRVAAVTIAKRVAKEMGVRVGTKVSIEATSCASRSR